jgi:hypothetical protein
MEVKVEGEGRKGRDEGDEKKWKKETWLASRRWGRAELSSLLLVGDGYETTCNPIPHSTRPPTSKLL